MVVLMVLLVVVLVIVPWYYDGSATGNDSGNPKAISGSANASDL